MRTRRSVRRRGLLLVGALMGGLMVTPPVDAQRGGDGRRGEGRPDRAALEQRMRAQTARMMSERLGLTEDQAERLSEVTQRFSVRRRELGRSERATRGRVDALMLEEAEDNVQAQELLNRMRELRALEGALAQEEQEALLEVITPIQILKMQSLREALGRRIRSLRGSRDDQSRARRRGGRGGGGESGADRSRPSGLEGR
jgi:Spy/CpxP family protein refolding chaperone